MSWTITRPTLDDLEEMGRVHVQVWQEAYAGLMPDDYLAALDPTVGPQRVARADRASLRLRRLVGGP